MSFHLAPIHEAIADRIPEREAIVSRRVRLTRRELQRRTRKLAHVLGAAGLGCRRERAELERWESGQDHVALYMYNGHEYLESMLGAFQARTVPFNVNYRYVEDELSYLFRDSAARAIIYQGVFAPRLAHILPSLPGPILLLQVDDGSGEALLPGALDYESALAAASDAPLDLPYSPDDLYMVYTGGTTGMPKGVLWRQEDIFITALGGRIPGTPPVEDLAGILTRADGSAGLRALCTPPFMHGAGHWTAFMYLNSGGTIVIQDNVRSLDADDIWSTVEREKVVTMSIVGDAFARPLIDQLDHKSYDLSSLFAVGSGGAIFSPENKRALLQRLPHIMIADGFGASETGAQGSTLTTANSEVPTTFRMDESTIVLREDLSAAIPVGDPEIGWLAKRGHVPLGYLGDVEKTRKTYPEIGGVRYAVPGDRAHYHEDGTIRVLGRDSVCINSGGEKIFAEEVEQALKRHPDVYDVLVVGTPSERWGQQVTAVVAPRAGRQLTLEELQATAGQELARYKLPRAAVFVDSIVRAPSGKPDYRWAREHATEALRAG